MSVKLRSKKLTDGSESLYLDYWFGKEAGEKYNLALREHIGNNKPMIGYYGVNNEGSDMYNKGATLLGMIRQMIDNDEKWRSILRGLNETFYHQMVGTGQIENFISERSGIDLSTFFDQYLRTIRIPNLEYFFFEGKLYYRWTNVIDHFSIPIDIYLGDLELRISPSRSWQAIETNEDQLNIQLNYYITTLKVQ